jgi:WhiB family redox-sensing transcriptional regulator
LSDVLGTAVPPGAQAWRWEWQERARCRGRQELFFHPSGEREPTRSERDRAARSVCLSCPVRRECTEHALLMREPYGVWGGMTELDRATALYGRQPNRDR